MSERDALAILHGIMRKESASGLRGRAPHVVDDGDDLEACEQPRTWRVT